MFKNWGLKAKLLSICILIATFTVVVGGIGFWSLKSVGSKYNVIASTNFPNTKSLGEMVAGERIARLDVRSLGISGLSQEMVDHALSDYQAAVAAYEQADKAYNDIPFGPGEADLYKPVADGWKHMKDNLDRAVALYQTRNAADRVKMVSIFEKDDPQAAAEYRVAIDKLIEYHTSWAARSKQQAESTATFSNTLALSLVTIGFGLAFAIGYLFSTALAKHLKELSDKLSDGANTVSSASEQVSSAGTQLSSSSTEQASALQETVASIEQVSAMVAKNAENAKRSQEVSGSSQQAAERGKQVIGEMIHSIDDISKSNGEIMQQIESSNREISEIVKIISDIGEKTKVINDIVFQTKLLSFNASVEAARAGEHGKGFAVVAEEVGNLAQMSGNAAKEISTMLEGSIQKVESTVNTTKSKVETLVQAGKEKVEAGSQTARKCGEVLDEIVQNVSRVGEMVSEIATASTEQAQGVGEINKAMAQMDQVTQQNASASEQAASAAEELTHQAASLRMMVQSLVATVSGGKVEEGQRMEPVLAKHPAKHAEVLHLKPKKAKAPVQEQALKDVVRPKLKKAAGAESIPSEDDPRFENV